jgi:hypothetical protein
MNDFSQTIFYWLTLKVFFHTISVTLFLFSSLSLFFEMSPCSYNDSRSHGGNNGGGGSSNLENFNTYGLSVKFLEGLGITQGPLHTKVFVANVSISLSFSLTLISLLMIVKMYE